MPKLDETVLRLFLESVNFRKKNEEQFISLKMAETKDVELAMQIVGERFKRVAVVGVEKFEAFLTGFLLFDEYLPENYTEEHLAALISEAASDFYAYQVLLYLELLPGGPRQVKMIKDWRQQHNFGFFVPPSRPRGPNKVGNMARDLAMVEQVELLVWAGFSATRNLESESVCACDIVARALNQNGHSVSYRAVGAVWNNRDKLRKWNKTKIAMTEELRRRLS